MQDEGINGSMTAEAWTCPIFGSYLTSRRDLAAPRRRVPTLPHLYSEKEAPICLICFLFGFLLSSTSVPVLSVPAPLFCRWRRRGGGLNREMMKFQGKVEVPSITGGGKVQINHLISPAFSPLSPGSRAKGKSITPHKWDLTGGSRHLCSGL